MKLKLRAFKAVLFLVALVPAWFHYEVTSPRLWSHNSSAAFDAWLFLWFIAISLPVAVLFVPLEQPRDIGGSQ